MNLTDKHLDFERICRQIIGLTIIKVEYIEIDYEPTNKKPYYSTHFEDIDSVDFSIIFYTDSNKKFEICWDGQFHQYEIGLRIDKPSDFQEHLTWNVTENKLWQKFINQTIVDTKLTWETISETEQFSFVTNYFTYPQDITLTFSNGRKLFISAAGFLNQNDKEVFGMLDNLTVTDNEELAKQVKMIN